MGLPVVEVSAQVDSGAKGVDAAPAAGKAKRGDASPLLNLPGSENFSLHSHTFTVQSSLPFQEKLLPNKGEDHQGKEYSRDHR